MSLQAPLSSPQDLRNWREEIYTSVRDDARLLAMIFRADGMIRARLRGYYTIDTDLEDSAPWNGPPLARLEVNDQSGNSGDGALIDVTPASTARTQQWTITFSSATAFSVRGSLSGSEGSGTTGANFTTADSELSIPSVNWSGTPVDGDEFFVSVYKHRPVIVALSSMYAAYYTSSEIFRGTEGLPPEVQQLRDDAEAMLDRLTSPYDDDGMRLGSFSERDVSPEGLQYTISSTGVDISAYSDNEQTPWSDGQLYSFINGPIWLT